MKIMRTMNFWPVNRSRRYAVWLLWVPTYLLVEGIYSPLCLENESTLFLLFKDNLTFHDLPLSWLMRDVNEV